jgi:hypothetical protein
MSKEGFVSIHGKEYKTVAKRVQEFRESVIYKGWSIMTDVVKIDDDQVLVKAQIINPESKIVMSLEQQARLIAHHMSRMLKHQRLVVL